MVKKELSNEQRERIIGAHLSGVKQKVISVQLNIAPSTVNDTIRRYRQTHSAIPKKRPGRPKVLTDRDRRVLKRIVREDRFAALPVLTGTLHANTVRNYLYDEGIRCYSAKKKPHLTQKQRQSRLRWCREKRDWK